MNGWFLPKKTGRDSNLFQEEGKRDRERERESNLFREERERGRERKKTPRLLILPGLAISYSFSSMKPPNILIINLPFSLMLG